MIFVHEFGHFITARICGVGVNEFSIGMGPKIFSKVSSKSQTSYSVRLFPIGGFVSMVGEDEESTEKNAFGNINVFKRMIIIIAGAFMNILLGFIIMFIIVILPNTSLNTNVVENFYNNSTSVQCNLRVDDKIIKVGNRNVYTGYDASYEIMNQGYQPIDITVIRNGEKIILEDVVFPTITQSGAIFGVSDFVSYYETKNIITILKHTLVNSICTVKLIWDSIFDLIGGRYNIEAISGPIGITQQLGETARKGPTNFLHLCSMLCINLGVVNVMPIPALDGGRLVFLSIEAIRRKPIKKEIESYIHFIGIVLLFALMIVIAFKDVWSIFIK